MLSYYKQMEFSSIDNGICKTVVKFRIANVQFIIAKSSYIRVYAMLPGRLAMKVD